jgi:hypothetical protein
VREADPRAHLRFYSFATGATTEIAVIDRQVGSVITVSPDGRSLLYSQSDEGHSDLMLVENFR